MNQKYLCVNHRQQLRNYPRQAVRAWSKSYENGQSLLAMGFNFEALAHLGCAYEAAEIALSANIIDTLDAVAMLTSSAATLARLLDELGQQTECCNVIDLTSLRIEKEFQHKPELTAVLQNQIQSLRYFVEVDQIQEYPLDDANLSILASITNSSSTAIH